MKILFPASINWFFMFQRPQQMLKSLAKHGHEVHFINKELHLIGGKNPEETLKPYKDLPIWIHPEERPTENQLAELNCDTLYYTFPPAGIKAQHYYDFETIIFDSVDEPDGVFGFWNEDGAYYDSLRKADYVIASAKRLMRRARRYNKRNILLPNACDYDFFIQEQKKPKAYKGIKKPIVLYSGAIATWVDIPLIEYVCEQLPDYQFVMVGAEMNDRIRKNIPNMKFLGHQPYETIPGFVQHADVCMIPFRASQKEVQSCNPIKMWEFFACGKPVVTTAMAETNMDGVYWAPTKEDFVEYIEKGVNDDYPESVKIRKEIARENSWDNRVDKLLEWMEMK